MRRLMGYMARSASGIAVIGVTLSLTAVSSAQPRYGIFVGDRDTDRVITYLQPTYNPDADSPSLVVDWECAYSRFARGYNQRGQQVMIYGIAIDSDNRRVWASQHLGNTILAFDFQGNFIAEVPLPSGVSTPRKMTVIPRSVFGNSYLYVSASNRLLVYGPLESNPTWRFFVDANGNPVPSYSGVRWIPGTRQLLIADSGGQARLYTLTAFDRGNLTFSWQAVGEDIDYIDARTILLAVNGNPGRVLRLASGQPAPIGVFIDGQPGFFIGIAVGPRETDGNWLIYVTNYETFPNSLYVYRYDPQGNQVDWVSAASPLPFKSGHVVAVGPVWDCTTRGCPEDITRDGIVDDADLLRVLFAFGTSCGN